jgi:hypothetical protein
MIMVLTLFCAESSQPTTQQKKQVAGRSRMVAAGSGHTHRLKKKDRDTPKQKTVSSLLVK